MAFQCMDTRCDEQWLYQIGEEGIVYSQTQNRIAGLDAAGVLAYQAFDAGASPDDLQTLSDTDQALPTTTQALDQIFALSKGLFPETQDHDESTDWPTPAALAKANLKIHEIPVLFDCPYEEIDVLCRDCFLSCPPTSEPARVHLQIRRTQNFWAILANEREILSPARDDQVGLGLLHAARFIVYNAAPYDVAFHAAMVADGAQHGIMLCAPREFGKSTLAAYLAAHGFTLVSDEPALLCLNTATVSPLEMPISLKVGVWEILEKEWPQLLTTPIHVRSDGCRIRLFHPPPDRRARVPQRLTHIIFPRYSPLSPACLEPLYPMRKLMLLNEGGMLLNKKVNKEKFEQLLELINSTPAYIAQYQSLPEAEQMLRHVLTASSSQSISEPAGQ